MIYQFWINTSDEDLKNILRFYELDKNTIEAIIAGITCTT